MSNIGLDFGPDDEGAQHPAPASEPEPAPRRDLPRAGSRRAERPSRRGSSRRGRGCLPLLIVLVLIGGGAFFGGSWALDKIKTLTGESPDYSGNGSGTVLVEVHSGDSSTEIGQTLKVKGVVKSVDAFIDAATADARSKSIQVGFYSLHKKMKATAALALLVDPKNLIQTRVVIPEGFRVKDIVKAIVAKTDITAPQLRRALKNPAALGLPPEAGGKVEGYLFPATYDVLPGATAKSLLTQMVDKAKQVEKDLDVADKAAALGLTPQQVMTVASILEYEGSRDQDYPKIAQAIYNRLKIGMRIQSDATVAYANNLSGTVYTTAAQRQNPSPYNTYVHTGLPPGPIGSPGETTIKAALNPVKGPWLYWVVVNLRTGETRFNESYAGHLKDVEVLHQYCQTSDAC
ncbi:MAG: endolytic transglycosylase MltG [Marmoricola sp.]